MPNRLCIKTAAVLGAIALLLAALLLTGRCADAADTENKSLFKAAGVAPSEKRRAAPDFSLPGLTGGDTALSDLRGKLVVINFWATWCGPCVKEMPALQKLRERYRARGLEVLAVSVDMMEPEGVATFIKGYRIDLPVLLDPLSEVADAYMVRTMPTTYIVGRDGTILGRAFGALPWEGEAAAALFEALLND